MRKKYRKRIEALEMRIYRLESKLTNETTYYKRIGCLYPEILHITTIKRVIDLILNHLNLRINHESSVPARTTLIRDKNENS